MSTVQRKLTVIMSADVVGYTGLMERDELGTLTRLKDVWASIVEPSVTAHEGRIFKRMGDGFLAEFPSAASAVTCALEVQQAVGSAGDQALCYRIGINLGDVIVEDGDIYGEGVNLAARLQAQAAPGGVCAARIVCDQVRGKINADFEDLGEHSLKNIERPVHMFSVRPAAQPKEPGGRTPSRQSVSVCVLPFTNMSGESEQEYFSDGITEDIITDLSKVSAIWVASRNTSFTFKSSSVDVAKVARQLNVSHILEGSVRKAGGRVRITAQLLDATGGHVWAERYDRELNDIFALQDEISQAVVSALKVKLLPEEKDAIERRDTSNAEAYELYLLAKKFDRTGAERMKPIIIRICRKVVELDPGFARAWALMAFAEAEGSQRAVPGLSFEAARAAAERAVELNPRLAEAHAALAEVMGRGPDLDFEAGWEHVKTALHLDPNCYEANLYAGYLHLGLGNYSEAIRSFETAAALDEAAQRPLGMAIQCYRAVGDEQGALHAARRCLERCERLLAAEPDNSNALGFMVTSLSSLGERERAADWAKKAMLMDPDNLRLQYNIACGLAEQDDIDLALQILEEIVPRLTAGWLKWIVVDSSLDSLRELPRYKEMMAAAEARLA